MNIFLPYPENIAKSAQSLDDKRLNKQILECFSLLQMALAESRGEEIKGYKNHPIYVHYKNNRMFLITYIFYACNEYRYRFNKYHKYANIGQTIPIRSSKLQYIPFYTQGQKGKPDCIRTTDNVGELYQKRLIEKWKQDTANGRPPKWTNREAPKFWANNQE